VSLHICGNAMPMLADMASCGADVLELDHQVELGQACRIVEPEAAIWGNLDPVGVLARGTVDDVQRATKRVLETIATAGRRRFVLSSGCTLAMETPAENLHALIRGGADLIP